MDLLFSLKKAEAEIYLVTAQSLDGIDVFYLYVRCAFVNIVWIHCDKLYSCASGKQAAREKQEDATKESKQKIFHFYSLQSFILGVVFSLCTFKGL